MFYTQIITNDTGSKADTRVMLFTHAHWRKCGDKSCHCYDNDRKDKKKIVFASLKIFDNVK